MAIKINDKAISSLFLGDKEIQKLIATLDGSDKTIYSWMGGWEGLAFKPVDRVASTVLADPTCSLQYSTNHGATWTDFPETPVDIPTSGMQVRGFGYERTNANTDPIFTLTGKVAAYGSIMSLIDGVGKARTIPNTYQFIRMFQNQTALVKAPEFTARTLKPYCYKGALMGTSITQAPVLPATYIPGYAYESLFNSCHLLVTPPELPALRIDGHAYHTMFASCWALETAPFFPAPVPGDAAYQGLFVGCSSLKHVKVGLVSWGENKTLNWFQNVTTLETFECPASLEETHDISHIPTGVTPTRIWTGLKFDNYDTTPSTVLADSSLNLQYSLDGGSTWSAFTDTPVSIPAAGVCVKGNGYTRTDEDTNPIFTLTGKVAASGNTMTLFDEVGAVNTLENYALCRLFYNQTSLYTAPLLPVYTVGTASFAASFMGCSNLKTPPALAANVWGSNGGCYMFQYCTSLESTPDLYSPNLSSASYTYMFDGCTSLGYVTELPATRAVNYVYHSMFKDSSIKEAPELLATTLYPYCYYSMFSGCLNLTKAPSALPALVAAEYCYYGMFQNCASLKTPPTISATTLANECCDSMFAGCTKLESAPALPATTLATKCYYNMFDGCAGLSQAPELPAMELAEHCYRGMFINCTSLQYPPVLPAPTLAAYCYCYMFSGCSKLSSIEIHATDVTPTDCLKGWLSGVAATGTIYKDPSITLPAGVDGCPNGWTQTDTPTT